jgi:diaminopropionate ammonia-lyase
VLETVAAGRIVRVPGPHDSIMTGLNCGMPSIVALPDVAAGFDLLLAIGDERAQAAAALLADAGVQTGPTGAAGLAGLLALFDEARALVPDAGPSSRALLFCTEG